MLFFMLRLLSKLRKAFILPTANLAHVYAKLKLPWKPNKKVDEAEATAN